MGHYIGVQLDRGPLPWLLAIPRLTLAPYFAADAGEVSLAMGPALVVLGLHYFWVLHSEVSFEEASISRAEKRCTARARIQQGDWRNQGQTLKPQRPPFSLASTGRPELAFLWKNLLATSALVPAGIAARDRGGGFRRRLLARASAGSRTPRAASRAALGTAFFAMLLLFGPQMARFRICAQTSRMRTS